MPKPNRRNIKISVTIRPEMYDKLEKIAKKTNLSRSYILDVALQHLDADIFRSLAPRGEAEEQAAG